MPYISLIKCEITELYVSPSAPLIKSFLGPSRGRQYHPCLPWISPLIQCLGETSAWALSLFKCVLWFSWATRALSPSAFSFTQQGLLSIWGVVSSSLLPLIGWSALWAWPPWIAFREPGKAELGTGRLTLFMWILGVTVSPHLNFQLLWTLVS